MIIFYILFGFSIFGLTTVSFVFYYLLLALSFPIINYFYNFIRCLLQILVWYENFIMRGIGIGPIVINVKLSDHLVLFIVVRVKSVLLVTTTTALGPENAWVEEILLFSNYLSSLCLGSLSMQ